MSDAVGVFHVKGPDGVIRSLDEHYDCQKAVEQDPHGAWLAIQNQAYRIKELEDERDEALNQLDSARHSVEVLEANVARLCEALYRIQDRSYGKNAAIARTTLKELKGENQ